MTIKQFCIKIGINRTNYYVFIEEGMPKCPDVEGAKKWLHENKDQRTLGVEKKTKSGRKIKPLDSSDTWEGRLIRARQAERETHRAYLEALATGSKALERLLVCHTRSLRAVAEAERLAVETQVATEDLLPRDKVEQTWTRLLSPLREALDKLPLHQRTNCNPQHPEVAERALTEWRDRFLENIRRARAEQNFKSDVS